MNIPAEIRSASQCAKIKDTGVTGAKDSVSAIIGLLGLRDDKIPSGKDMTDLLAYVYRNLDNFSSEEFRLAGTLFAKGLLDYQKDLYDRISPLFIENIMQSYSRYRLAYMEKKEQIEPERIPTPFEIEQTFKEVAIFQFNKYKKSKFFLDFNGPLYLSLIHI